MDRKFAVELLSRFGGRSAKSLAVLSDSEIKAEANKLAGVIKGLLGPNSESVRQAEAIRKSLIAA